MNVCKLETPKSQLLVFNKQVPSITGFDSDSSAHFRSESVQRFIYLIGIEHFVLMERVCLCQLELVVFLKVRPNVHGPCPSLPELVMPRKLDAIEAYILSLNNNNNSLPDYLEIA